MYLHISVLIALEIKYILNYLSIKSFKLFNVDRSLIICKGLGYFKKG